MVGTRSSLTNILSAAPTAGAWCALPATERQALAGVNQTDLDHACTDTLTDEVLAQASCPPCSLASTYSPRNCTTATTRSLPACRPHAWRSSRRCPASANTPTRCSPPICRPASTGGGCAHEVRLRGARCQRAEHGVKPVPWAEPEARCTLHIECVCHCCLRLDRVFIGSAGGEPVCQFKAFRVATRFSNTRDCSSRGRSARAFMRLRL